MVDPRIKKWADLLVQYSNEVQPGEWCLVQAPVVALPLVRELYRAILEAGGHPTVRLSDGEMQNIFFNAANDDQLDWVSPVSKLTMENADCMFTIWGSDNTRALSHVDPARMARAQASQRELFTTFLKRMAEKEVKWIGTQFPTQAHAQEAEMSLSEYEEFVLSAMLLHTDDPVAEWRKVSARQQAKVDWLKGKKQVTVKSANADLSLSIEGRIFDNAAGRENMPDGEIYTSPVEDSVNGWVRFTYPAIYNGRSVEGVELHFEQGKIVKATASKNEDFLKSQLTVDAGASYLGEFAIGTNFGIKDYTGEILYDEKIGGTFHVAVGAGFPELGGKNESAVHWDMICDMRQGGEIHVDGELFYKDGDFVV
ncbi:MAG: aminopeptidase [Anaerolineae bacterium]|nr:aminopeptidase [Anaerolineae bacterium]